MESARSAEAGSSLGRLPMAESARCLANACRPFRGSALPKPCRYDAGNGCVMYDRVVAAHAPRIGNVTDEQHSQTAAQ